MAKDHQAITAPAFAWSNFISKVIISEFIVRSVRQLDLTIVNWRWRNKQSDFEENYTAGKH